jgi:hypothetical protein
VRPIGKLAHADLTAISTLFIPPLCAPEPDTDTVRIIKERESL